MENAFKKTLFCFLFYHLNLCLFELTLSVHLKVWKVHFKITIVPDTIRA